MASIEPTDMSPEAQRRRRYLGWARNLDPASKRQLVIDPLAKRVLVELDRDQAKLIDKPLSDKYGRSGDQIKAWHLHATVYLLIDGVVYDTEDRKMKMGLRLHNQNPVIDAMIAMFPRQFLLDGFIDKQIRDGNWIDRFDQSDTRS